MCSTIYSSQCLKKAQKCFQLNTFDYFYDSNNFKDEAIAAEKFKYAVFTYFRVIRWFGLDPLVG